MALALPAPMDMQTDAVSPVQTGRPKELRVTDAELWHHRRDSPWDMLFWVRARDTRTVRSCDETPSETQFFMENLLTNTIFSYGFPRVAVAGSTARGQSIAVHPPAHAGSWGQALFR